MSDMIVTLEDRGDIAHTSRTTIIPAVGEVYVLDGQAYKVAEVRHFIKPKEDTDVVSEAAAFVQSRRSTNRKVEKQDIAPVRAGTTYAPVKRVVVAVLAFHNG